VETADAAIISETWNGVVLTWNRGAERIFGYSADEIVVEPCLPHPRVPQERRREDNAPGHDGKATLHCETVWQHKDGKFIDVAVSLSPVVENDKVVRLSWSPPTPPNASAWSARSWKASASNDSARRNSRSSSMRYRLMQLHVECKLITAVTASRRILSSDVALSLLALAFHERALHALAFGGVGGDQGQRTTCRFRRPGQADGDIDEFSVLVLPDGSQWRVALPSMTWRIIFASSFLRNSG